MSLQLLSVLYMLYFLSSHSQGTHCHSLLYSSLLGGLNKSASCVTENPSPLPVCKSTHLRDYKSNFSGGSMLWGYFMIVDFLPCTCKSRQVPAVSSSLIYATRPSISFFSQMMSRSMFTSASISSDWTLPVSWRSCTLGCVDAVTKWVRTP